MGVLDVATAEQKEVLAQCLSSQVNALAQDVYGSLVIQKALKVMPCELCERVVGGLEECIIQCMKNLHGNHVVQACIDAMPAASIGFIIEAVEAYGAAHLAMHMYACNVLVRLLEHVQGQQLQNVMHQISSSVGKLAQDRYGSYVLQHIMIMENGTIADRRKIGRQICHVVQCGGHRLRSCV